MRMFAILAVSAVTLVGSSAGGQAKRADTCFWPSQVSGFSDGGRDRALVRIGSQAVWELTVGPGCPNIDYALQIGIRARGGQRICAGRPAELIVPFPGSGSRSCLVRNIRRLSDAEAAPVIGLKRKPRP
ncbi:DUF6491 family protein [Sphingomonas sp. RS2018]